MTLRIVLKPGERVSLNGAIFEVSQRTTILLHNRAALLRCSEMITEDEATTPAKRLYFDLMNLALAAEGPEPDLDPALRSLERLRPSSGDDDAIARVEEILELLVAGRVHKALMRAKAFVQIETEHEGAACADARAAAPLLVG